MNNYFVDLHIHIGRTKDNKPVKITAAKSLTLENILEYAVHKKGLDVVGIIDCHVPGVIEQLETMVQDGELTPVSEGGLTYERLTLFLGSEIEIYDVNCKGPIHVLAYFPTLEKMKQFSRWLSGRMTNYSLSSQRLYESGKELQHVVKQLDGLFIPAHIFTPFKSLYGKGVTSSLTEVFDPEQIDAVELGLSSDTAMAEKITELGKYPFLSNSDAHSLEKIAREYQVIQMEAPTFQEFRKALLGIDGRGIKTNYGLDPRLGKYHESLCEACFTKVENELEFLCNNCGHRRFTRGVADRIAQLAGDEEPAFNRPPYMHQIPLEFIPKLGPKTLAKLRETFGTDMTIIHHTDVEALETVCSEEISKMIIRAREGRVSVKSGGAGRFGKLT